MAKKTPLYEAHIKYGGDMVEFAGYELPMRYENYGVITEHKAVRTAAGLFDVSHMGEFIITGANAEAAINKLLTNDIRGMYDGQIRYSPMPNERGGAVDDLIVYRFDQKKFLLVVNAANKEKDERWILENMSRRCVKFENASDSYAQLALQGPKYKDIMLKLVEESKLPAKYYSFTDGVDVKGVKCLISRTGYTGEGGYELYCKPEDAIKLYETIMEAGKEFGLIPCGLGCRDTLRLEAAMPLYGHELSEDYNLSEVDLGFAIKLNKEEFIGKAAIENHVAEYARIGVKVEKGIAREHDPVFCGDEQVGEVTSGTHAPFLGYAIAMLRIKKEYVDKPLEAVVRGRKLALTKTALPFYKK